MAQPAQRRSPAADPPPIDPTAIDRAYRFYRAQRYARTEHRRETRHARLRFWVVVALLLLGCLVLAVTVWDEIQRLFGL